MNKNLHNVPLILIYIFYANYRGPPIPVGFYLLPARIRLVFLRSGPYRCRNLTLALCFAFSWFGLVYLAHAPSDSVLATLSGTMSLMKKIDI